MQPSSGPLVCCDLAVVQGELRTTVDCVANRRSFVYIPLRNHFELKHHVVHRLRRYGAADPTPYDEATSERLAAQMLDRLGATVAPLLEKRKSRRGRTWLRRVRAMS